MRKRRLAGVIALAFTAAGAAHAADEEAGVPLSPAEAGGVWTLQSKGQAICEVTLSGRKDKGDVFAVRAGPACRGALPSEVAGWRPNPRGMDLVGADGAVLITFSRWSNSLLVSRRSSGEDLQLQRGGPHA